MEEDLERQNVQAVCQTADLEIEASEVAEAPGAARTARRRNNESSAWPPTRSCALKKLFCPFCHSQPDQSHDSHFPDHERLRRQQRPWGSGFVI